MDERDNSGRLDGVAKARGVFACDTLRASFSGVQRARIICSIGNPDRRCRRLTLHELHPVIRLQPLQAESSFHHTLAGDRSGLQSRAVIESSQAALLDFHPRGLQKNRVPET